MTIETNTETHSNEIQQTKITGARARVLSSMKVKTRISVGFLAILAVLAVVAAMGYSSLTTISHEMTVYSHQVEESEAAASVETHFFELEIFVREFVATSNMEDAKKARAIATELRAEITDAAKLFKNAEQLEKLAEMSKGLEIYAADFDKVVKLDAEFKKLIREVLDPVGDSFVQTLDKMRKEVSEEGNADAAAYIVVAREHVLQSEIYANIMIGRKDDSYAPKVHHEFNEVHAALKVLAPTLRTAEEKALFTKLNEEFETYIKAFEKVVEDQHEIADLIENEMNKAAETLTAAAEWIVVQVHAESDVIKAEAHAKAENAELIMLILSITGLVLGIALSWFIGNAISKPIAGMTEAMQHLANGDLEADIPARDRGDEIGQMAGAVQVFKDSAVEKLAQEAEATRIGSENMRIRAALDNCTTNVMVADADYDIVYMNEAVQGMLASAESEIRKVLPQFDARNLIGQNIDIFHKNPAHQRAALDRLTGTHEASIQVADCYFELTANPVFDGQGGRIGSVVEWKDITAERKVEEEIDQVVNAAVAGDFSQRIAVENKSGFMRNLAEAMNRLSATTSGAIEDVASSLSALSEGDLTRRIDKEYEGLFGKLKNDANATAEQLSRVVTDVSMGSSQVASASEEISVGTTDLSQRTEQQASNLEETAASMEQMASTVKQNADNAQQANQLSASTRDVASKGGEVVSEAVEAMSRIEESSQKISDIIGVIDEIAFQTNLLALNAAVEAARAGDAGKGFAVVSSEVRTLAQRSSQAAKDIKALIVDSGSQVKDGVQLVNRAGESLGEIVDSIKRLSDIVSEIAAASGEQSNGVEEINKAITQMDEVTQQNSALVDENAAAARTLQEQSQNMRDRMEFFKTDNEARAVAVAGQAAKIDFSAKMQSNALHTSPAASTERPVKVAASGGGGAIDVADQSENWDEF